MHRYRVFLSYAHEDRTYALKLRDYLDDLGLAVMWDKSIGVGEKFSDRIRRDIAHAHLFIPLITETSLGRPWVHHETGFAMGLGVPVMTVAVGKGPEGMIGELQASMVSADLRPDELAVSLNEATITAKVAKADDPPHGTYEPAEYPEGRAQRFADGIGQLEGMDRAACTIRQDGALTSFNLPNAETNAAVWDAREGLQKRTEHSRQAMLNERRAFEALAREAGCKLIFDPSMSFKREGEHAPRVRRARLTVLRQFLESMADLDHQVQVVARQRQADPNVTIIGDWFAATALIGVQPQFGYRQTLFTWHAPTVLKCLRRFDEKFDALVAATDYGGKTPRVWAIDLINETLATI